jgi:MoxR-like ATPase
MGGLRLVNGSTVAFEGPVPVAMREGAVLLLDEIDSGTPSAMMVLQPVLENKPVILSKSGTVVKPTTQFNIIATANTRARGDDDGRYIGTNALNEAHLDRYAETVEHFYPPAVVERQILTNNFKSLKTRPDQEFIERLIDWARICRIGYDNGSVGELVSTRRLVSICRAFVIFDETRAGAIRRGIRRFDKDTQDSLLQSYTAVDADATAGKPSAADDEEPW